MTQAQVMQWISQQPEVAQGTFRVGIEQTRQAAREKQELHVRWQNCKEAVARSEKRLVEREKDVVKAQEAREAEETKLSGLRASLADLAEKCKEKYGKPEEQDRRDAASHDEQDADLEMEDDNAQTNAEQYHVGSDSGHGSWSSRSSSWWDWNSKAQEQQESIQRVEDALLQQQLATQQQIGELKTMFAVLAQQFTQSSDPARAARLSSALETTNSQEAADAPLQASQPNVADIAHMHLAGAVPVAAATTESAATPTVIGAVVSTPDASRRRASPRSPIPSERSRPNPEERSRATSAFPRGRNGASTAAG